MSEPKIRVLLVEDHQVVREGLRALLRAEPDINVVGEAADGLSAFSQVGATLPDVVLMDLGLPGLNGVEAIRRIRAAHPTLPVLVLSMYDDAQTVDRALRAGAKGYVLKGLGVAQLCTAIRKVHQGDAFLSPQIAEYALQGDLAPGSAERDPLSPREREVMQLIAEGYTSRQIADRLGLSTKTVSNHRANIIEKLGVRTTAGLVRYAIRAGISR